MLRWDIGNISLQMVRIFLQEAVDVQFIISQGSHLWIEGLILTFPEQVPPSKSRWCREIGAACDDDYSCWSVLVHKWMTVRMFGQPTGCVICIVESIVQLVSRAGVETIIDVEYLVLIGYRICYVLPRQGIDRHHQSIISQASWTVVDNIESASLYGGTFIRAAREFVRNLEELRTHKDVQVRMRHKFLFTVGACLRCELYVLRQPVSPSIDWVSACHDIVEGSRCRVQGPD